MKNTFLTIATAAVIATSGFTSTTLAADDSAPPPRPRLLERLAEKLNLTDDQKAQIKAVLTGEKDMLAPLLNQLHEARMGLRAAIQATGASEASVRAASAKVAGAEADLAVERMKLYGKIAPILTDAQRQKAAEMQQRADDFVDGLIERIGSGLAN